MRTGPSPLVQGGGNAEAAQIVPDQAHGPIGGDHVRGKAAQPVEDRRQIGPDPARRELPRREPGLVADGLPEDAPAAAEAVHRLRGADAEKLLDVPVGRAAALNSSIASRRLASLIPRAARRSYSPAEEDGASTSRASRSKKSGSSWARASALASTWADGGEAMDAAYSRATTLLKQSKQAGGGGNLGP